MTTDKIIQKIIFLKLRGPQNGCTRKTFDIDLLRITHPSIRKKININIVYFINKLVIIT